MFYVFKRVKGIEIDHCRRENRTNVENSKTYLQLFDHGMRFWLLNIDHCFFFSHSSYAMDESYKI